MANDDNDTYSSVQTAESKFHAAKERLVALLRKTEWENTASDFTFKETEEVDKKVSSYTSMNAAASAVAGHHCRAKQVSERNLHENLLPKSQDYNKGRSTHSFERGKGAFKRSSTGPNRNKRVEKPDFDLRIGPAYAKELENLRREKMLESDDKRVRFRKQWVSSKSTVKKAGNRH